MTFVLNGTVYRLSLAPGHKTDGAEFNRFGLFNQQTTGSGMEVSFRELTLEGEALNLTDPTGWEAHGNQAEFHDHWMRPFHDFGWNPARPADPANQARPGGEIGGVLWRDEKPAHYAAPIRPLTLEDELFASGTVTFQGAGSDSGAYIGWFNSFSKTNKLSSDLVEPQKDFLAVLIEGPSHAGHYFRGAYATALGEGAADATGPIIRPDGRRHQWSIRYSPQPGGGDGQILVRFDDATQTLAVSPAHRRQGASFDRFGLFNLQVGGHFVDVAFDDLTWTAAPTGQPGLR
jgi:hypothetical protein